MIRRLKAKVGNWFKGKYKNTGNETFYINHGVFELHRCLARAKKMVREYMNAEGKCFQTEQRMHFNLGRASKMHLAVYKGLERYAIEVLNIPVVMDKLLERGCYGEYVHCRDAEWILLDYRLKDTSRMCFMTHELSHALLHRNISQPIEDPKVKAATEFEADLLGIKIQRNWNIRISNQMHAHLLEAYGELKDLDMVRHLQAQVLKQYFGIIKEMMPYVDHELRKMRRAEIRAREFYL